MGKLTIVNRLEDNIEFVWDPGNEQEVEAVKKVFEEYIGQGFKAFRYASCVAQETVTFDKDAEEIFIAPSFGDFMPACAGG